MFLLSAQCIVNLAVSNQFLEHLPLIKTLTNSQDLQESLAIILESEIFDTDFYNQQLNKPRLNRKQAILDYLNIGAENKLDPHPLFDTTFYIKTNTDIDFTATNPLTHFITAGWQEGRNPHPLFDVQYYLAEYKDVAKAKINPLQHFILFGAGEHRRPCEFFDTIAYKKKVHDLALRQYFANRFAAGKNIGFSRRLKTTRIKDTSSLPAYLAPYLSFGKQLGVLDWFKSYRLEKISPLIEEVENPLLHFLSQGLQLGFLPFASFELLYDVRPKPDGFCRIVPRDLTNLQGVPFKFASFANQINKVRLSADKLPLLKEFIESFTLKKSNQGFMRSQSTILLVSHQATYTGSPMLLLQIARALSGQGFECLLLLEQGGVLEEEFSEFAHIINLQYKLDRHKKCAQYLSLLFDDLKLNKPDVCLINSLEGGHYAKAVDEQDIKIISLVHEIVDSYAPGFLQDVFNRSQSMIFPAKFVQDFFHKKAGTGLKSARELIIPNALLEEDFGKYDRDNARTLLRQEIEAPQDSLVVLACGSPDMRKGIDYFVTAARIIITKRQQEPDKFSKQPVHFVWIGAGKIEPWSAHYYIDWDLRQENLQSQIHLLAPKKDLRSAFRGSDIFVLPSRQDAFPIVVHNAMAAELPIISFRNAGGGPEMVEGGGAKLVPYGDMLALVQAIEEYMDNEQQRLKDGQLNALLVAQRFRFHNYFAKLETEINAAFN